MPSAIDELRALLGDAATPTAHGNPIEELQRLIQPHVVDANPTPDELDIIKGAPPNRPAFSLKPPVAPAAPGFEPTQTFTRGRFTGLPGQDITSATPNPMVDPVLEGVPQAGRGVKHLVTGEGGRMNAASDVIEGAMKASTPALVATGIVNPIETLAALVAGYGGQEATSKGVTALGGSPEASRLAGNVGGLVVGGAAAHGTGVGKARIMDALRKVESPNAESASNVDQLQAREQAQPGVDRETAADDVGAVRRGNPAPANARQEVLSGNDTEAGGNAPIAARIEGPLEGAQPIEVLQALLGDLDADGASVRAPGRDVESGGPTAAEVGARASQERGRVGQPAREPGTSDSVRTSAAAQPQSPIEKLRSLVGDHDALPIQRADASSVQRSPGAVDEGAGVDLGARDAEHQEPPVARAEAEAPVGSEGAEPAEVAPVGSPRTADLSDEHLREIRRIVHELDAMGYTDTTWTDLTQEEGVNEGNAGGGKYDRRPAVAGAKVYDDIYQMAPGSSKATRAKVQAQLERYLAGGKPTQAVQGAIEIARLRMEGKQRIPGDGKLSSPELPPSAGEVPTRLEAKPSLAEDLPAEDLHAGEEAEPATGEGDVEGLGDWFKQQAEAEQPAAAEASNPIEELARLINEQPAVAEAPFSLEHEAAESTAAQPDLFKPEKPKFGDWQKAQSPKRGDVTLQSTLVPGAKEFAEQDLAPIARGLATSALEIKNAVSPQTASREAQATADTVREAKARVANAGAIDQAKYNPSRISQILQRVRGQEVSPNIVRGFAKASDAQNIANISAYERTGQFEHAPEGYSEFYKKSMTDSRALLQHAYGDDAVGQVENYVRRAFKFGSPKDEADGTSYLVNRTRTLSANRTPLKGRVLDMPLDEALADMQRRGIKVQMATTNPELLRQWSMTNARQAASFKEAWQEMKEGGLVTFVKMGKGAPSGLVPINERGASFFYPKERGLGQYYADPNVARVLNNATSQGLGGSATYRGLRAVNNSMNQLQLGLSLFHATGTAINAGISDLALGVRRLGRGDVKGGAAAVARSVVPGASFARDMWRGRNLIEGLKRDNPEAYKVLDEQINPSGARLHIDQQYANRAMENMRRAFSNENYLGAAWRLPFALVEQAAKPLMTYAIPRVKIGALLDLTEDIQKRMPDATPKERARALASASDSIDNRFGQLVHDNLFWNKTAADLSQLAVRSVGWNLGTIREIGGGLADTRKLAHGEVTDRLLYTAALPLYVGMIGATYQYMHTGEMPSEPKDYFYPKNGRTEPNGMVSRTTLPTYMKDVEAYSAGFQQGSLRKGLQQVGTTLAHKTSPLVAFGMDLARNEDYFGNMIANPDDPTSKQMEQMGKFALKEVLPLSVQQYLQSKKNEDATTEGKAESFMGFVKAPASMERTPAEALMHDFLGPQPARTPEQVEKADTKRELRAAEKKGDAATVQKVIDEGKLGRRDIRQSLRSASKSAFEANFQRLSVEQAMKVYEVATPAQRANIRGVMVRKWQANVRELSDEKRGPLTETYDRVVDLPYDKPSLTAALQPGQ